MDKITIVVDGTVVEGRFLNRSASELSVTITSPFSGMKNSGGHIPYFARSKRDYLGEYGEEVGRDCLRELYEVHVFIDSHRAVLRDAAFRVTEDIEKIQKCIVDDRAKYLESKKELKKSIYDKLRYQKDLQELKKVHETNCSMWTESIECLRDAFFQSNFNLSLHCDLQNQILEYLK